MLALAGALAMGERRGDPDGGVESGEDVGKCGAALRRLGPGRSVGRAGARHDAAHALDHEVVSGAPRVRAGLAEAGDRAVDQLRVERLQTGEVEAVFLQAADLEV